MNKITIAHLNSSDWQKFKDIRLEAVSSDPDAFETSFTDLVGYPDMYWQGRIADPRFVYFFAKDDERIIGMAGAHIKDGEEKGTAVIIGVYLNKDYRGQGTSKLLLNDLLEALKKKHIAKLKLCVMEHQEAAEALYKSVGFKETGRKDDAKETENGFFDEILMERTL